MTSQGAGARAVAYVALGSNLGDRSANLELAIASLRETPGVCVDVASSVYETEPVGPPPQGCYLNAVLRLATSLTPEELLGTLLEIERRAGRERNPEERWRPRPLDLDLLLYADRCIESEDLVVPHPRLHERAFVLVPLHELAPDLVHPRLGLKIAELASAVDRTGVELHTPPAFDHAESPARHGEA